MLRNPDWREIVQKLDHAQLEKCLFGSPGWARDDQLPPDDDWTTWILLGGRGAGKTFAGAHLTMAQALGIAPLAKRPAERIALVGESFADIRDVMIEGVSGLLAVHRRDDRPIWSASRRKLTWPNGAVGLCFSSEDPESLRGPQFAAAWCDELAKWKHAEATWDMLQFGLRLGTDPRQTVTTTPRPIPLLKRLLKEPGTRTTRLKTAVNRFFLAPTFLDAIVRRYEGTRLGRQELDAEMIEERDDALWRRATIEEGRVDAAPELLRIVIGIDPPASSGAGADACGLVTAGIGADGRGYVLADRSAGGLSPAAWAGRAIDLFHALGADRLVAERNQGGEMAAVIRQVDANAPLRTVHASRGKLARAEPIAALYEQGRVSHVGTLPALEDEMCDFGLGGLSSGRSPDRVDALVWALSELMLGRAGRPGIRSL